MSIKRINIILVLSIIAIGIVTITNCINTAIAQCTTEQLNKGSAGCSTQQSNTSPLLGYLTPSEPSAAVAVQNNVSRTTQPAKINPVPAGNVTAVPLPPPVQNNVSRTTQPAKINPVPAGNVTAVPLPPPPKRIVVGPSSVNASPVTNEIQGVANATSIPPNNGLFLGTPTGR